MNTLLISSPRHGLAKALVLAMVLSLGLGLAKAFPTLEISPTQVQPGEVVLMTLSGFNPGGYDGTIHIDDVAVADIEIFPGGSRTFLWMIPEDLSIGGHDFYVCAACNQGDLEERTNTVRVTVESGDLTGDQFNLQPWGIEITQAVRGDFAVRTPPEASLNLPSEDIIHVANRRTVVRVYPWVEGGPDFWAAYNIKAQLWATRDGTTYGPIEALRADLNKIRKEATIDEMRSDLLKTWNFVLPQEVLALDADQSTGSFDLTVTINPEGADQLPECGACFEDNTITLNGNVFSHVGLTNSFALKFRPFLMEADVLQEDGSTTHVARPPLSQMLNSIRAMYGVLPIADGNRGVRLMPWRNVDWSGTQDEWDPVQDEYLIRTFLPGGVLHSAPRNDYYAFLYWGGDPRCSGHSFPFTPFLRSSACPSPSHILAHELNHAIGANHAGYGHGEINGGGYDPDYPVGHGQVEADSWGLDVYRLKLYPPNAGGNGQMTHDFMSYGPSVQWVSQYSWNLTAENLGSPEIGPGKQMLPFPVAVKDQGQIVDYVNFRGLLNGNGQVELQPFFGSYPPDGGQGDGTYSLEFTGSNGELLSTAFPRLTRPLDTDQDWAMFGESIALPVGWQQMMMRENNIVIQTWERSPNRPEVELTFPEPGFNWPNTGQVTLTWDAHDLDGDDLLFRVLAQQGAAGEIFTLATHLEVESFTLDRSHLPAGGEWTFLVEASDGWDRVASQLAEGWVEPTPPQLLILEPEPESVYVVGSSILAMALIADLQGDVPDEGFDWYLDGNWVGSGTSFQLPPVAPGDHHLQLMVYNAYQESGTASVQFDVLAELSPPNLVSPSDGATQVPLELPLRWTSVPGASSYRIQVSDHPEFTSVIEEVGNLDSVSITFTLPDPGQTYFWRVMSEHGIAPSLYSQVRSFTTTGQISTTEEAPRLHQLDLQIFPNPFNPETTIAFDLGRAGPVKVEVFDLLGRRVRALTSGPLNEGPHRVSWNGRDESGLQVGSGVYLVRLVTSQGITSRRVMLLK